MTLGRLMYLYKHKKENFKFIVIMDYEKKYKDALSWMQSLYEGLHGATKKEAEHYFPELKESDDEKIRKELIGFLRNIPNSNYTCEEMALWLEKQGVQPRYNIGDVICDKSCTTLNKEAQPNMEIVDIKNGMYICDKGSFPVSHQNEYELVSKKIDTKLNDDSVSNELRAASVKHAEKELKNHTFPNNEEFELVYTFEEGAKWNAAQKHNWSDEDEEMLNLIIKRLQSHADVDLEEYSKEYDWLNSPKARSTWKPSDEQMDALEYHLKHTNENSRLYKETKNLYDQLKKLK
jgi:hypothetical protein